VGPTIFFEIQNIHLYHNAHFFPFSNANCIELYDSDFIVFAVSVNAVSFSVSPASNTD